jgi:hypothetical protein
VFGYEGYEEHLVGLGYRYNMLTRRGRDYMLNSLLQFKTRKIEPATSQTRALIKRWPSYHAADGNTTLILVEALGDCLSVSKNSRAM